MFQSPTPREKLWSSFLPRGESYNGERTPYQPWEKNLCYIKFSFEKHRHSLHPVVYTLYQQLITNTNKIYNLPLHPFLYFTQIVHLKHIGSLHSSSCSSLCLTPTVDHKHTGSLQTSSWFSPCFTPPVDHKHTESLQSSFSYDWHHTLITKPRKVYNLPLHPACAWHHQLIS